MDEFQDNFHSFLNMRVREISAFQKPILKGTPCHASSVSSSHTKNGIDRGKGQKIAQVITDYKLYLQFYQKLSKSNAQAGARDISPSDCSACKAGNSSAAGTSRASEGKSPSALPRAVLLSVKGQ